MKKLALLVIVAALVAGMALSACAPAPAGQINWKLQNFASSPEQYPWTIELQNVIQRISDRTDGNFNITFHMAGELGITTGDYLKAASDGTIEGFTHYSSIMIGDVPVFSVPYLPYLGTSLEDKKTTDDVLRPIYAAHLARLNVEPLMAGTWGFTYPWMTKEIPDIMDWSGLKIRTLNKWHQEMVRNMGGEALVIPRAEVFTALQTGVVDGDFTSAPSCSTGPTAELFKYAYVLNVGCGIWGIVVNKDAVAALPDKYREVLYDEAAKFEEWGWNQLIPVDTWEEEGFAILQSKYGVQIVKPTQAQLQQMAAKNAYIWDMWADETPQGHDILNKVKQALGY